MFSEEDHELTLHRTKNQDHVSTAISSVDQTQKKQKFVHLMFDDV